MASEHTNDPRRASPLLSLPAELQLMIFELVVVEPEILLLNCPCNSSYENDDDLFRDFDAWSDGLNRPPTQPALAMTCSAIRPDALAIFYQRNSFRAHYCHVAEFETAKTWLITIGPANRALLRHMYLWDDNESYDDDYETSKFIEYAREFVQELGGSVDKISDDKRCCHHVVFPEIQKSHQGIKHLKGGCND